MKIEISAKTACKLGPKICLVELNSKEDKMTVMENKRKLRDIKDRKIFINNDMTFAERDIARRIRKIAQEERSKGNNVQYGYHKVTVNGKQYRWNRQKDSLEEFEATDVTKN